MSKCELVPFDRSFLKPYLPQSYWNLWSEHHPPHEKVIALHKFLYMLVFLASMFNFSVAFRAIENATYEWSLYDDYQQLLHQAAQHPPARFGFHPNFDYLFQINEEEVHPRLKETFKEILEYRDMLGDENFIINVFTILNQAENPEKWEEAQGRLAIIFDWAKYQDIDVMVSLGMGSWSGAPAGSHPFDSPGRVLETAEETLKFYGRFSITDIRIFYEANSPYQPQGIIYGNRDPFFVDGERSERYQYQFAKLLALTRQYLPTTQVHANVTTIGHGYSEYSSPKADVLSVDMYNNYVYMPDSVLGFSFYNYIFGKQFAYQAGKNWLEFFNARKSEAIEQGQELQCGIGEIGRKYGNESTEFWMEYMIAQYLANGCNLVMIFDISKPKTEWDWKMTVAQIQRVARAARQIAALRNPIFVEGGEL